MLSSASLPLGGIDLSYRDSGPAVHPVPVILVHGMGGDGRTWDPFVRALRSRGRRVVTVDLRGHGRSGRAPSYLFEEFASDLVELCDELGFSQVDLVGHSLGGHATTIVAQERPALVRRLVVEEAPLPLRTGDDEQTLARRLPSPVELWHALTSLVRSPRAVIAFDRSMTAPALDQFRSPDERWWSRVELIEAPVLVLRGGPTGMVDPQRLDAMTAMLSDVVVHEFSCGHSIHRDRYREFEAVVLPFLLGA
ncbi:alpha/beta hydrolase [Rhodococcus rhodnii]|nr:alpha/beta hydrolase [Rhodococcus rhodnii]TXG92571.1 alpha/beta hydrolase [Rhodococcus rhodnii]